MKKIIFILILPLLIASSCSKKTESANNSNGGVQATWYLYFPAGTSEYTTTDAVHAAGSTTLVASNAADTITFNFLSYPTANATYRIVPPSALTSGSDMSISMSAINGAIIYQPMDTDNVTASITVTGGKVSISVATRFEVSAYGVQNGAYSTPIPMGNITVNQQ